MRRVWAVLVLALVACGDDAPHPRDFTIAVDATLSPIAVMARQNLYVVDACQTPTAVCTSGGCCTTQTVSRVTAAATDPIVLTMVDGPNVTVIASATGTTQVRITADLDGTPAELTRTVEVRVPDRVLLDAPIQIHKYGENQVSSCLSPVIVQRGVKGYIGFRALAGGLALVTTGWVPLEVSGPAITLQGVGGTSMRPLQYYEATNVGMASISTTFNESSTVNFEVVDDGAIDGARITGTQNQQLVVGSNGSSTVNVLVLSGGREICHDDSARTFEILTPEVCEIFSLQVWPNVTDLRQQAMPAGVKAIGLHGLREGTCSFRATIDGTNYSATGTLEVVPR